MNIAVSAYPGEVFTGKVFYISDTLNEETRTIHIMAGIDNRARKLKPGMYADTHIVVGESRSALVVPEEAVLDDESLSIVFVREEGGYHRHVVQTGTESHGWVEIVSGLDPGAEVVTTGAYQLKSRMKMAGIDPHAGHNH